MHFVCLNYFREEIMAVSINENLCCGDKLCINICPCECIELNGENKAVLSRKGSLTCIPAGSALLFVPREPSLLKSMTMWKKEKAFQVVILLLTRLKI